MDVDKVPTSILPPLPPEEKKSVDLSDVETVRLSRGSLLPAVTFGERQRSAMLRQTLPQVDVQSVQEQVPISANLSKLIEHREHVANLETRQIQALTTAAAQQEHEGSTRAVAPDQPQAKKTKAKKRPGSFSKRKRVPVLQQISIVECGAACLAMLLSYYGRQTTISEIREQCGVGRDGLTALSIVKAARTYGMRVRALSLQENDFRFVPLPAIVHWEFNHFVIVERWSPKQVEIVDPAVGRCRLTAAAFDESFTGVVITMEPGPQFARGNHRSQLTLATYARDYIRQAPGALVQVLATSLLLQLLGLIFPLLSAIAIDQLIPGKLVNALQLFGIGMVMLVLAQVVTRLLRSFILLYVQSRVDISLMFNFLDHLFSLPQRFFLQRSTGDILARVSSNSVIRDTISNQLFSTLLDGSFVMLYFFILLSQSPVFAIVVFAIGVVQALLLLSTGKPLKELNQRELTAIGKSQGYITEVLAGIKTLKSAGAEYRALERWSNLFFEQMNISVRRIYITAIIDTVMSALAVAAPLTLLWLGTLQVINGSMEVGTMIALNALGSSILGPLSSLIVSGRQIQLVQSHMERLADVIEAEPEQDLQKVVPPPRLSGHITLRNVSFQYDPQSPIVLHNINVDIQPGQKVAIVGRTGSGKSTFGSLLLGLSTPTKGEIRYDDLPLQRLNYQAVRSQFGVVMQEADLFSGSIRENITLNDPTLSMEQIIKAAQIAAIHEDIMQMPMEYETMVSEGGNALSGGQRQRLAIARAVANAPVIILLDEATSSLDVMTEKAVEQHLNALACTQIIIAHRLSTIRNADVILVLNEGKIIERGTHQELLTAGGYYAQLIQSQLSNGEVLAL
jgi:ABC-type bacteriocin/lantibiotic exporter with double-glycine peptidase domain